MNKIKACIFDLDGVIVDTAKYHYLAWKDLADRLGFVFTHEHNERLKGVSRMASLDILLEIGGITLSEKEKEQYAANKNELYRSYILKMNEDEILPGVKSFLQEVRDHGLKIALGSASKNAVTILDRLHLHSYFDAVVDGTKVSKAKPEPEVFLLGAGWLGIPPHECIVFEDAEAGIEAAINAGMKSVGIGSPAILGKADWVIPGLEGIHLNDVLKKLGL